MKREQLVSYPKYLAYLFLFSDEAGTARIRTEETASSQRGTGRSKNLIAINSRPINFDFDSRILSISLDHISVRPMDAYLIGGLKILEAIKFILLLVGTDLTRTKACANRRPQLCTYSYLLYTGMESTATKKFQP